MPEPTPTNHFRSFSGVAALLCCAVGGIALAWVARVLAQPEVGARGMRGDSDYAIEGRLYRDEIARRGAGGCDIAFIGNSMLICRIEADEIEALASPRKVALLKEGNTFSPVWYLAFEQVAATGPPPRVAIVFFRDRMLTWPGFRLNENAADFLHGMMGDAPDPLVVHHIEGTEVPGPLDEVIEVRDALAPPNHMATRALENLALDLTKIATDKIDRREQMNERFALHNLRHDVPADVGEELDDGDIVRTDGYETPASFSDALEGSLLPDLFHAADRYGTSLVFHRVKRRPGPDGTRPSNPSLDRYIADLRDWIESSGGVFIDENGDRTFTEADYADGDHLRREARPAYTRWFWDKLAPHLDP